VFEVRAYKKYSQVSSIQIRKIQQKRRNLKTNNAMTDFYLKSKCALKIRPFFNICMLRSRRIISNLQGLRASAENIFST
jgi:hypothetical protein